MSVSFAANACVGLFEIISDFVSRRIDLRAGVAVLLVFADKNACWSISRGISDANSWTAVRAASVVLRFDGEQSNCKIPRCRIRWATEPAIPQLLKCLYQRWAAGGLAVSIIGEVQLMEMSGYDYVTIVDVLPLRRSSISSRSCRERSTAAICLVFGKPVREDTPPIRLYA